MTEPLVLLAKGDGVKEQYDNLQHNRKIVRSKITKLFNKIDGLYMGDNTVDLIEIESSEIVVRRLMSEVDELNQQMKNLLGIPTSVLEIQQRESWELQCDDYEDKIAKTMSKLHVLKLRLVKTNDVQPTTSQSTAGGASQSFEQMAELVIKHEPKIPKFGGDVKKFRDWLQTYEAAVASCKTNLAKFHRLKEALVGPAYKVISCIEFSENNYNEAIKAIKEEYGRTFTAQYAYGLEIIKTCNSRDFKSSDKWFALVPNLIQQIKNLRLIVKDFEGAAVMILPIILENIPIAVREAFMRVHEISDSGEAEKQLEALQTFMKKESQIHSTSNPSKSNYHNSKGNQNKFHKDSKQNPSSGANGQEKSKANHSFYNQQETEGNHACIFCEHTNHPSHKCKKTMTNVERAEAVKSAEACTKCLRRNHVAAKCRQKTKCKTCEGAHHTMLCFKTSKTKDSKPKTTQAASRANEESSREVSSGDSLFGAADAVVQRPPPQKLDSISIPRQANLATGYAFVCSNSSEELRRVLLDTGSQRSFITNHLAKCLKAKVIRKDLLINHTLGGTASEVTEFKCYSINLKSRFGDNRLIPIECLGIPTITQSIFPPAEKIENLNNLADLVQNPVNQEIDVLLGAEDIGQIWLNESVSEGKLIGINSRLGWFTFGKRAPLGRYTTTLSAHQTESLDESEDPEIEHSFEVADTTNQDIEFMFQTELLGVENLDNSEKEKALEQEKFEKIFAKCIKRLPSGRLSLKLPFNDKLPTLGSNENLAKIRLNNLISKSSPEILAATDAEISNYLEMDYVELAPKRKPGEFAHYLPIQIVKKAAPDTPSGFKIRLVKDAGSRSRDLASLNDVLITGQNLLPNVLKVLTKFREKPLVICSDITKAFHQFEIDKSHRTFLRFFWRPGIASDANAPIREFQAKRLDFGLVSSPWLHQAGVKFHLDEEKIRRPKDKDLIEEIQFSIYMDDLSFQSSNLNEA